MTTTNTIPAFSFAVTDSRPVSFFKSVPGILFYSWNNNGQTLITFSHSDNSIMNEARRQYSNEYSRFNQIS